MVSTVTGSMGREHGARDRAVDPAVLQARRVVGLYGDPDVTWSVVLALRLTAAHARVDVGARAAGLVEAHPHLGAAPVIESFEDEAEVLDSFANRSYGDRDPLLRVALSDEGRTLVLAAHHGAIDGLGLLGAASALLGAPLESNARGIPPSAEPRAFVRSSVRRLGEALFRPPARVPGDRNDTGSSSGDWLAARPAVMGRPGSAALVRAAVDLVQRADPDRERGGRLVVSMGLSRRPGSPVPTPDRDTAYMRLRAGAVRSVDDARTLIDATPPEPAFPVTDGRGLAPRVARLFAPRLGATVLASNLGRVDSAAVATIRFWPVPTGPAGVCLGLASTPTTTTLTLRARRRWFSEAAASRLADLAAESLVRAGQ
jgi:hypothetical protein